MTTEKINTQWTNYNTAESWESKKKILGYRQLFQIGHITQFVNLRLVLIPEAGDQFMQKYISSFNITSSNLPSNKSAQRDHITSVNYTETEL